MKKNTIKLIILTLLFPTVLLLAFVPIDNPPQKISITIQERDAIVKGLTDAYNIAAAQKNITVGDAEAILVPLASTVNFLKTKQPDSTTTKK